MTKTRYIPQGFIPYTPDIGDYPKDLFAVYVKMDDPKKLAAIFYTGNQSNHTWFYGFPSLDDMKSKINDTISRIMSYQDVKAKRKADRTKPHTLKVGDILYSSWGYDQTNIDFYQVIDVVSDRTVKIRQIASKIVGTQGYANDVVPVKDSFITPSNNNDIGKVMTKRVKNGNSVNLNSYADAWLWDGRPKSETATGYGH